MKTEMELIKDLKDTFETDYQSSTNIIEQPKVSAINADFFLKRKEWCEKYVDKFTFLYEALKKEKLDHRMVRSLQGNEDPEYINLAIKGLEKHRDAIIKKLAEEAERKRKAEEAEIKKRAKEIEARETKQMERDKKFNRICDTTNECKSTMTKNNSLLN